MKKAIVFVLLFAIIIAGVAFYHMDKDTVEAGKEPKYCLKFTDEENKKTKYLCLGYAVYREYVKSPNEVLKGSKSVKFGLWFLDKKSIKYSD